MLRPSHQVLAFSIAAALASQSSFANENKPLPDAQIDEKTEIIVISGSRTEKKLSDVAGSISVTTAQDIDDQVVSDMSQLFKYDPSIQVTGKVGGAQNILVRGMGGNRVLMVKDGMRMNEGYGANGLNDIVGRGFIDTSILKQVEIAKGGASSLYGSDALSGIVVFTTKDAADYLMAGESFASEIKTSYSDLNDQTNLTSTFALATGQLEQLLNISVRDGEEAQNYQESESPFAIKSHSVFYKAKYHFDADNSLAFTADTWQQDTKGDSADGLLSYFRGLAAYGYIVTDENIKNDKSADAFQLSYKSTSDTALFDLLNISLYINNTEQQDKEYGQLDINAPAFGLVQLRDMWKTATFEQKTVGLLSNASIALNDSHRLGYGIDIEKTQSVRSIHEYRVADGSVIKDDNYNKFPDTDTFRAGIFVNDEITLLDNKLTVTPGMRVDFYKMDPNDALNTNGVPYKKFDETHTSFNLGGIYKLTDDMSVFVQYGQGFKVPAYDLAYIEHYNQPTSKYIYQIVASDNLSPEESQSYELGLKGQFDNFSFNAAVFNSQYDNFLATKLIDSKTVLNDEGNFSHQHDTFQYQNVAAVTIKGFELTGNYFINQQWSMFANMSYVDGKDDETNQYIDTITPLTGIAGLSFENENLVTKLVVNWATKMNKINPEKASTAGFGVIDLLANYEINAQLTLNLNLSNILDKEYIKYGNIAGHAESTSLVNQTEAGRTIAASMVYRF